MAEFFVNDASGLEHVLTQRTAPNVKVFVTKTVDVSKLKDIRGLTDLEVHSFRGDDLSFLEPLSKLKRLTLDDFPNVKSLGGLKGLSNLRSLALKPLTSKIMNGKTQAVETFHPIASLFALEEVEIEAIVPAKNGLSPFWYLPKLRRLDCDNRYQILDYVALQKHQPKLDCHWLQPTREARHCECSTCGTKEVILCGSKPRRVVCPNCSPKSVAKHQDAWQAAVSSLK